MNTIESGHPKKFLVLLGSLFIGLGLLANEWILATLFSPDGDLQSSDKVIIWIIDLTFIVIGAILVLFQSHPLINEHADLLGGILLTCVLFLGIEGLFLGINDLNKTWYEDEAVAEIVHEDTWLGYGLKPAMQVSAIKKRRGDTTVYSVTYTIDAQGRRYVPPLRSSDPSNFLLFFGGSFVFGHGVNDDETLPYYVAQLAPSFRSYNYGVDGYGPQQMLAKLERGDLSQEIHETQGILIYVFIDHHVNRAIGSMFVLYSWGDQMPFYTLDPSGQLIRQGDFASGRPVTTYLSKTLGKSQVIRFFKPDYPILNDSHFELSAKIITEAKNQFRTQFDDGRFYVLFYPSWSNYKAQLQPYLEEAGVAWLDYANLIDRQDETYWINHDGHPKPEANALIAEQIVKDVTKTSGLDLHNQDTQP